ncbi:MAG: WecB/TagA/CpsF family glycosyltransferase [Cyanobacteria bacterium P01_A01_bin.40]
MIPKKELLNIPITCLPFEEQIMLMLRWAKLRTSKVVCLANVHMLMEAYWNPTFAQVLHRADLVTPDGKPLVLMLRRLGIKHQNQVAGMDVFLNLCDLAEQTSIKVYFLGSTESVLEKIKQKLNREYPILQVVGTKAIAKVTIEDILATKDHDLIDEINQSGAGLVFVCLGCPKQEIWMSRYQGSIQGVMIGVGAVFSMYAGINPRAPHWIQGAGLEWLYRLLQEPRRLWRRYGSTIPPFLYLALRELAIPYKQKLSQARWQLTARNVVVDVDSLDYSAEKLGEILVRQDIITKDELKVALLQQFSQPQLKLGQILVRLRLLSLSQLKFYLRNQNDRFGDLLLEKRILNRRSLKNIMTLCSQSEQKIGEVILEQSIVSKDQLKELLIEHYTRKKGLFLAENVADADLSLLVR